MSTGGMVERYIPDGFFGYNQPVEETRRNKTWKSLAIEPITAFGVGSLAGAVLMKGPFWKTGALFAVQGVVNASFDLATVVAQRKYGLSDDTCKWINRSVHVLSMATVLTILVTNPYFSS